MSDVKLLLIMEDKASRQYLAAILTHLGYESIPTTSPAEASRRLAHEPFAAVMMDRHMTPYTRGMPVSGLRECGYGGPVILMNGLAEDEMEIIHDPDQGDIAVISHSVSPTLLRKVLDRVLSKQNGPVTDFPAVVEAQAGISLPE